MTTNRPPVVHIYPKGTYKAPSFYFRGSEALSEPETVRKQFSIAREQFQKIKSEVMKERAEFSELCNTLSVRDDYTVALATALGNESTTTTENAYLRNKMAKLTIEIESIEREISHFHEQSNTYLLAELIRERAYFYAEMQNQRINVLRGIQDMNSTKTQIASLVASDQFSRFHSLSTDYKASQKHYNYLRRQMNQLFHQYGTRTQKHTLPPPDEVKAQIAEPYNTIGELAFQLDQIKRQKVYTAMIANDAAYDMIMQIQRMNQVLVSLGGDQLNLQEIYSHLSLPEISRHDKESQPPPGEETVERPKTAKTKRVISSRRQKQ